MNDYEQVLKIDDQPDNSYTPPRHKIEWNYQYADTNTDWRNKKTPRFLHQDPRDSSRMYLLGRYYGTASVIKFNKFNFQNDYRLQIRNFDWDTNTANQPDAPMHDILAYL